MSTCNEAVEKAQRLVQLHSTRDADRLAKAIGLIVVPRRFKKQKGVYTVIERNRYVFIKDDLHPAMHNIVLLHEIGHDVLHRAYAVENGGFQEFDIFDTADRRMEFEANVFASQVALPDDEFLEYVNLGYSTHQIAKAMNSDVNLVALKIEHLNNLGHVLIPQEHKRDFLK